MDTGNEMGGYLERQGKLSKWSWKSYWCVLRGNVLTFHKDKKSFKTDKEMGGADGSYINLSMAQSVRHATSVKHGHPIEIITRSKTVILSADSVSSCEEWISKLQQAIQFERRQSFREAPSICIDDDSGDEVAGTYATPQDDDVFSQPSFDGAGGDTSIYDVCYDASEVVKETVPSLPPDRKSIPKVPLMPPTRKSSKSKPAPLPPSKKPLTPPVPDDNRNVSPVEGLYDSPDVPVTVSSLPSQSTVAEIQSAGIGTDVTEIHSARIVTEVAEIHSAGVVTEEYDDIMEALTTRSPIPRTPAPIGEPSSESFQQLTDFLRNNQSAADMYSNVRRDEKEGLSIMKIKEFLNIDE